MSRTCFSNPWYASPQSNYTQVYHIAKAPFNAYWKRLAFAVISGAHLTHLFEMKLSGVWQSLNQVASKRDEGLGIQCIKSTFFSEHAERIFSWPQITVLKSSNHMDTTFKFTENIHETCDLTYSWQKQCSYSQQRSYESCASRQARWVQSWCYFWSCCI